MQGGSTGLARNANSTLLSAQTPPDESGEVSPAHAGGSAVPPSSTTPAHEASGVYAVEGGSIFGRPVCRPAIRIKPASVVSPDKRNLSTLTLLRSQVAKTLAKTR